MNLVIFGLSVSSSWGNGHAALWRGLIRALLAGGHRVTFFERDVPYYAQHRDLHALPPGGELVLYPEWDAALPRMRGRAVIPWHILTGQRQGGATLFWIDEGTDSGPVAAQAVFPIDPDRTTARALYDRSVGAMLALLPPLPDLPSAASSTTSLALSPPPPSPLRQRLRTFCSGPPRLPLPSSPVPLLPLAA